MLQLQAGTEAGLGESGYRYEHHPPKQTLLYQLVEGYYPALLWSSWPHRARTCLSMFSGDSSATLPGADPISLHLIVTQFPFSAWL